MKKKQRPEGRLPPDPAARRITKSTKLSPQEVREISKAAEKQGLSIAEYLRKAALSVARSGIWEVA